MSEAVSKTRTSQTHHIQEDILTYLRPSEKTTLGIEIPTYLPKEGRGLENIATARFLIPRRHLEEFEDAPQQ
jgi:hypothetical protein